jgi:hypothetical protein
MKSGWLSAEMLNRINYRVLDLISQMRSEQRATYEAKGNGFCLDRHGHVWNEQAELL